MVGILAFGAYAPAKRLQRAAIYETNRWFAPGLKGLAKGELAICNWDEDVITMAVEAARDCLAGRDRGAIASVMLASTSHPFADRQNAGIVKEALDLPDAVCSLDIAGSQKAGVAALLQACHAAAAQEVLVIGSEKRSARPGSEDEMLKGAAAAGFVVGPDDGVARLVSHYSLSVDFVDHFRAADSKFDSGWENRWISEEGYTKLAAAAAQGALQRAGLPAAEVARFILGVPVAKVAADVAKKLGLAAAAVGDNLMATIGSAGCAHPLLMLAHALETAKPGDKLLVVGFGQGAEALLFEATGKIGEPRAGLGVSGALARRVPESNYAKCLALDGHIQLELGKRAEFQVNPIMTAIYRERKAVFALVGGQDPKTGAVQFPKSQMGVGQEDLDIRVQEDYPLADRLAKIVTYTADSLTFTPDPPNYYGMIDFEGGGRLFAEFADVDPENIYVGAPMRMMFRIKSRDSRSGFIQYFWKAAPAERSK